MSMPNAPADMQLRSAIHSECVSHWHPNSVRKFESDIQRSYEQWLQELRVAPITHVPQSVHMETLRKLERTEYYLQIRNELDYLKAAAPTSQSPLLDKSFPDAPKEC